MKTSSPKQTASTKHKRYGLCKYDAFQPWRDMIYRCTKPKNRYWHLYGGRGISVCERWMSFANFLADMGEKPHGMTLERRDCNGNYEPSNCAWVSIKENSQNTRKSRIWIVGDERFNSLRDVMRAFGVSQGRVQYWFYGGGRQDCRSIPRYPTGAAA